jgi:hypothetical protein
MMNDEIERWTGQFLAKDYRWETIVGWVTQNLNLEIEPSDIRDMASSGTGTLSARRRRTSGRNADL